MTSCTMYQGSTHVQCTKEALFPSFISSSAVSLSISVWEGRGVLLKESRFLCLPTSLGDRRPYFSFIVTLIWPGDRGRSEQTQVKQPVYTHTHTRAHAWTFLQEKKKKNATVNHHPQMSSYTAASRLLQWAESDNPIVSAEPLHTPAIDMG